MKTSTIVKGEIEKIDYKDPNTIQTNSLTLRQSGIAAFEDDRARVRQRCGRSRPPAGAKPSNTPTGLLISTAPGTKIDPISTASRKDTIARTIEDGASEHITRLAKARAEVVVPKEIFKETA